jgi:sporulation protein YlmC with PRC-barrel domain
MSSAKPLDLGLGLLDHQLVDSEGRRCGNVDDLELEGVRDGEPRVTAILVGPPAWRGRGWLGRLAASLAPGGEMVRVPWEEVDEIEAVVQLKKTAHELRLGRGDDRARKWVERIPGS